MKPEAPADDATAQDLEPQHQGADGRHQGAARRGGGTMKGRVVFIVRLKPDDRRAVPRGVRGGPLRGGPGREGPHRRSVCESDEDEPLADHQRMGLDRRLLDLGAHRGAPRAGQAHARLHGGGQVVQVRGARGDHRGGKEWHMIKRGLIVAKIKPGAEEDGAAVRGVGQVELPRLAGVRRRSLFVDDVYIHYLETDDDFAEAVDQVREHPLFARSAPSSTPTSRPTTSRPGAQRRTPRRASSTAGIRPESRRRSPRAPRASRWRPLQRRCPRSGAPGRRALGPESSSRKSVAPASTSVRT